MGLFLPQNEKVLEWVEGDITKERVLVQLRVIPSYTLIFNFQNFVWNLTKLMKYVCLNLESPHTDMT